MTNDVERQLSDYARFLDSTMTVTDVDAIIDLDRPSDTAFETDRSAPVRRPWVVAVVAFALALIAIGGVSLLSAPGGEIQPADETTPLTLPTPSTSLPEADPDEPVAHPIQGIDGSVIISARWTTSGSAVEAESGGSVDSFEREETVWYLDAETWRKEISLWREGGSTELQGAVTIVSDGEQFDYYPRSNAFEVTEYAPSSAEANPHVAYDFAYECDAEGCVRFGGVDRFDDCAITEDVIVLSRSTTQYECSQVPEWDPTGSISVVVSIDSTGRTLKGVTTYESEAGDRDISTYEVLALDTSPTFDPALFDFTCPTEDCRDVAIPLPATGHPMVGQQTPEVAGDLLGGGTFDIADHRGERIVILLWASWCPPCTGDLADLEEISAARPDLTIITGAVFDSSESVSAFVEDLGVSLPVVDLYTRNLDNGNYLADMWGASGIPIVAFVDEAGTIVAMWEGSRGVDEIAQTIRDLGW